MGQPTCSSFGSTSETGQPMDYAKLFQLLALGCVCVGCSTANTGSISSQSPQGSVRLSTARSPQRWQDSAHCRSNDNSLATEQ